MIYGRGALSESVLCLIYIRFYCNPSILSQEFYVFTPVFRVLYIGVETVQCINLGRSNHRPTTRDQSERGDHTRWHFDNSNQKLVTLHRDRRESSDL